MLILYFEKSTFGIIMSWLARVTEDVLVELPTSSYTEATRTAAAHVRPYLRLHQRMQ